MTPLSCFTYPPARLRALCGLPPQALTPLLEAAVPVLLAQRHAGQAQRPGRQRAVGGGRRRGRQPEQEILMTLLYLRHNVAHEVVGALFGVSADTSEYTFNEVVPILQQVCPERRWDAQKRWQKGQPSWEPTAEDRVLIDSFETPMRRPSVDAAQRRVYSGKKKRHTLKTQLVTDAQGEILELDAGHRGPTADKSLFEQSAAARRYPQAERWADRGYQGTAGLQTPHKKPQGGELTPEQREANRAHARVRVRVEHGVRRLKGFRILREDYRLAPGLFPRIAAVVVGLVHLVRLVGTASS